MAISFPTSPSNGDTYSYNGITYQYDSTDKRWTGQFTAANFSSLAPTTLAGNPSNDTDTDAPLVSDGNGGFKWGSAGGGGGGISGATFANSNFTGTQVIATNVDVSGVDSIFIAGEFVITKSGGSGAGTVATSVSVDGGTTYTNAVASSNTSNFSTAVRRAYTFDVSSVNTATIQLARRILSGSGSGRYSSAYITITLGNDIAD